jgi:hypothetical protein
MKLGVQHINSAARFEVGKYFQIWGGDLVSPAFAL